MGGGMLTYSQHKCKHECIDNDGKPSARSIRDDGRSYYLKSDDDSVLLVKANIPARGRARKFTLIEAERQHYFGAFGNLRIGAEVEGQAEVIPAAVEVALLHAQS